MKTSELTGAALAWAAGVALGYELSLYGVDPSIRARVPGLGVYAPWRPHFDWSQGGPIIEREELYVTPSGDADRWKSYRYLSDGEGFSRWLTGPTPLIAAMRCFVASKLGDEIDVPKELT